VRWISGRGDATRGAAGPGGAAMRGGACGAIAGRCGGGAARNAGAAGRATIAGGAAGRAIPGGGPAGRAAGAAAPPGRAPPRAPRSCPDEAVLTMITATPRKNARRTGGGSMIATPLCFVARNINAQAQKSFAFCLACIVAVRDQWRRCRSGRSVASAHLTIPLSFERIWLGLARRVSRVRDIACRDLVLMLWFFKK
jgi:hypothetical protein